MCKSSKSSMQHIITVAVIVEHIKTDLSGTSICVHLLNRPISVKECDLAVPVGCHGGRRSPGIMLLSLHRSPHPPLHPRFPL